MPNDEARPTQGTLDKAAESRWDEEGGGQRAASDPASRADGSQVARPTHSTRSRAQILLQDCRDPE
jgi:hypothetical protein